MAGAGLARVRGRFGDLPWIAAILGGIAAGMHLWKVPPYVPTLRAEFGVSVADAGMLIGVVQLAGVLGGLLFGVLIASLGVRRSLLLGLGVLTVASLVGGFAPNFGLLLAARAAESFGYMLAVVGAPALVRAVAAPERLHTAMGWWASYQGISSGLTLASAALFVGIVPWQVWWWGSALVSGLAALLVLIAVEPDAHPGASRAPRELLGSIGRTIRWAAPWLVGLTFTTYALSWMAVIGFLPTAYADTGVELRTAGLLTALASAVNIVGAFLGARLIRTGLGPRGVVWLGASAMGLCGWLVFGLDLPFLPSFLLVCVFSALGGLMPAVLTRLAVESAPADGSLPIALGLVQQLANLGMFIGPVLLGVVVDATGGWSSTWLINAVAAVLGALLIVLATNRRFGVDWRAHHPR